MPFDPYPGGDPLYMPPAGGDPIPDEPETIVVTAHYYEEPWWYYWGFGGHPEDYLGGFIDIGGFEFPVTYDLIESPVTDDGLILVKTNITRALTAVEQKAVDNLMTAIAKATVIIDALPGNSQIRMTDGSIISGTELKDLWSKTDFVINDASFNDYANKSGRGEADYNGGNPQVSFNIDLLVNYNTNATGAINLVFHELGHMTEGSRKLIAELSTNGVVDEDALTDGEALEIERYANDVAHAFSTHGDYEVYPWDDYASGGGFSPTPPTITQPSGDSIYEPVIPHWKVSSVDDSGHAYLWLM